MSKLDKEEKTYWGAIISAWIIVFAIGFVRGFEVITSSPLLIGLAVAVLLIPFGIMWLNHISDFWVGETAILAAILIGVAIILMVLPAETFSAQLSEEVLKSFGLTVLKITSIIPGVIIALYLCFGIIVGSAAWDPEGFIQLTFSGIRWFIAGFCANAITLAHVLG